MARYTTVFDSNLDWGRVLKRYKYLPDLTAKLDALPDALFDQGVLNEIVLWKVNRYAAFKDEAIAEVNALRETEPGKHEESRGVLTKLLGVNGVDLPMASAILRFRNPDAFQVIDRRAFRALYGRQLPVYRATPMDRKVNVYFAYLGDLASAASRLRVPFRDMDRLLYQFDKEVNGLLRAAKATRLHLP